MGEFAREELGDVAGVFRFCLVCEIEGGGEEHSGCGDEPVKVATGCEDFNGGCEECGEPVEGELYELNGCFHLEDDIEDLINGGNRDCETGDGDETGDELDN